MKLVFLSDTHNRLDDVAVPDGDVLIHSGDALGVGSYQELVGFSKTWNALPHKHKIFVPGNHDKIFETMTSLAKGELNNTHVLIDEGVTIDGINFYGSPWQPEFFNWAFNLPRDGIRLKQHWEAIPHNTDVLITHCPPFGVLDSIKPGKPNLGCVELVKVLPTISPKVHVFGHIHGGYGVLEKNGTTYINASICTEKYKPTNVPIIHHLHC